MARGPLFSTYRQGENRVTASLMAVFERIDTGHVERLLAAASGESALSIVTFANQRTGPPPSVPDAVISASCQYLFEVKTSLHALSSEQLRRHLEHLDGRSGSERLFALTPDPSEPSVIAQIADPRLVWFSFTTLSQAIDEMLADPSELVSEQARFLLRELQALFREDGLLGVQDTVVVAARHAWGEYQKYSAYVCQPGRAFRVGLERLGFYTAGEIKPMVPRILETRDNVLIAVETVSTLCASSEPGDAVIGALIQRLLNDGVRREGTVNKILLLSAMDDERTARLPGPIANTSRDHAGRPCAWTQHQRYTLFSLLSKGFGTTRELDIQDQ